ncbi:Predicted acetyltransferase [Gracilibacillus ureilyticus]|uniref:Predicted acetyltransferase n=1 Tax=Gracilibacillus ureilyticus TaxID=531814 RepID=A0A1H9VCZ0_9BACI|nr:GNAT family N-acetyltransferase [Gracilibacillus ureilyticus]SES19545.1 Predicted acetyltransferase [Gracilibacillus ureilyticus]
MEKPIKLLTEKDYKDIFELSQFAFQYKLSQEQLAEKEAEAKRHKIWGWIENNRLAAKVHMIPLEVHINDQVMKMGGIASVSSWPEYRRGGFVKKLLKHTLMDMRLEGYTISYLHPFSVPFYRKYGYELAFNYREYNIAVKHFQKDWDPIGKVKRIHTDHNLLDNIYTDYINKFNGAIMRDDDWWKQRVIKKETVMAAGYGENGSPDSYILYHVKERVLYVEEIAYRTLNGLKLLLEFIRNHDSMVEKVNIKVPDEDFLPYLFDEPRFEQEVKQYFMARIVNVAEFLNNYQFRKTDSSESITLIVEDDFIPENKGEYSIQLNGRSSAVNNGKTNKENVITCSVQQLTQMLLSFKRPLELEQLALIKGSHKAIEHFDAMIPTKQTYFPDFF